MALVEAGAFRPRRGFYVLLAGMVVLALSAGGGLAADRREEIVVSASPVEHTLDELVAPVTVLDRGDVLTQGGGQLGETLGLEPGIAQSSFARGASRPIIRGLDNFRVRVQENGIAAHDASALSEDHGVPIDPLSATRIEVIRGPAVLRYGSEAIGGLVSILNNRVPKAIPGSGFAGEAFAAAGSVDEGLDGGLLLDAGHNGVAVHLDAYGHTAQDYRIPRSPGREPFTDSESWGAAGGASLIGARGHLGLALARFESEYGIPAPEEEELMIELEQTRATLDGELALGGLIESLALTGGYTWYSHDEVEIETGAVGSTFDNEEGEARLELVHAPLGPLTGAFGMQIRARDLSAGGEGGELLAPNETLAFAAFLFEEWTLTERLRLQFGARVEDTSVEGTGLAFVPPAGGAEFDVERDFTAVSGSVGGVLDLGSGVALGATLQYVERAPDALELFAKGPHEATETFEIGNPDLGKESAVSAELTLRRGTGAVTFDLTAFYTRYEDFIFKSFTGIACGEDLASCGVEDELDQIVYGQADAHFAGFEAEADWRFANLGSGVIGLHAMADYVDAEFGEGGNVPRMPPMRYGGGFFYESPSFEGRITLMRIEKQDETAAFEEPTKGHLRLDAGLAYTFTVGTERREVTVGLEGRNLLDEDIRNHVSFKKEGVLLPGASARFYVAARF